METQSYGKKILLLACEVSLWEEALEDFEI
jgi:hypothetical protein